MEPIMFKLVSPLALASALIFLPFVAPAEAHEVTYVSGKGTDTGTCTSPTNPCRTFQFAVNQTIAAGEVKALDPANFGNVTITKSISITGVDGAGIDASPGSEGIFIKAGPKDVINLTNLIIDGLNEAQTGILTESFGSLTVTHSTVMNFVSEGISISSGTVVLISDVLISNNGSNGITTLAKQGTLDHVTVNNNGQSCPPCFGIEVLAAANVNIVDTTVTSNRAGIQTINGGNIQLAHSVVTGNGSIAIATLGPLGPGKVESAGNNFITGSIAVTLTEVGTVL
jgi:hypothetical protein